MNSMQPTFSILLGQLLLRHGINDLFCIPGDFTMPLIRELNRVQGLSLRMMSHENGTTLAAIGYALSKHVPSAVCFTYGVGILNAVNAIAQAYVEHVPMIIFSGYPGTKERQADIFLHHTVVDDKSQYRIMREVTVHQVQITSTKNALEKIQNAIFIAKNKSRPVYVEIARDIYLDSKCSLPNFKPPKLSSISNEAKQAAKLTLKLLNKSKNPVLVPGLEIKRFNYWPKINTIIKALNLIWVSSPISNEPALASCPKFRGVYAGPASPKRNTCQLVEQSDLIMLIGEPNSDVNMGIATHKAPEQLIRVYDGDIKIGNTQLFASTLDYIDALTELCDIENCESSKELAINSSQTFLAETSDEKLSPYSLIQELQYHYKKYPDMPLIVDCGDSFFMSLDIAAKDILSSTLYMSMGIAVPGSIGYQLGNNVRPIVLVGDGAFQMTGMELIHARKFKVSPIIIVLNNKKWISLSVDEADDNITQQEDLDFSRFAHFLNIKAFTATTNREFRQQLIKALHINEPVLIDAQIESNKRSYLCERFFDAIKTQYHLTATPDAEVI